MARHIFKYLNNENTLWVEILIDKYCKLNFWHDHPPPKCSWFFRGLCKSATFIKQHCKIKSVNPTETSFLWDPWIFDIPVALKPMVLNMNANFDHINISNLVQEDQWDNVCLNSLFGNSFDSLEVILPTIDHDWDTHWVWKPKSNRSKISAAVYNQLNHHNSSSECSSGWQLLWNILVAPRLKYFTWICIQGCLSTSAFLHCIHLGPDNPYNLCGMHHETIDHLFCHFIKFQRIWEIINYKENLSISFPEGVSFGNWITEYKHSQHSLAIIAMGAWFIWTRRCNAIFKNISPNQSIIVSQAINYVWEFSNCFSDPLGKTLILNNFSNDDGYFLFTHTIAKPITQVRSIDWILHI